jgi:toxin ParE1/3/4
MSIDVAPRAQSDIEMAIDELGRWRAFAGDRFLDRLHAALTRLEQLPYIAGRYEPTNPAFPDLRVYTIRKDYGYIVYYVPAADGIVVVRVLHGSRNLAAIFGGD